MPYADPGQKRDRDRSYYERVTKPRRDAARKEREQAQANPQPTGPKAMIHVKVLEADKFAVQRRLSNGEGDATLPQDNLNAVVAAHLAQLAAGRIPRYIKPKT